MPKWAVRLVVFLHIFIIGVDGRLTEITTERLPILSHYLHKENVNLNVISKRALLGPRSEFRFKNGDLHQTAKGSQRVRLIQTYAGYEVYGPTAVAELDMKGHFTGHLYGEVARNLHKDIPNPEACVKDVNLLLNIAIRLEKLRPSDPNIDKKDGRRVIYADSDKRKAKIIYIVEFFYKGKNFVSFPVYYMDACSQSVIMSFNKIRNVSISETEGKLRYIDKDLEAILGTKNLSLKFKREKAGSQAGTLCDPLGVEGVGGNPNTGQIFYNNAPYCLPVKVNGLTCTMEGNYVDVIDNLNTENMDKKTPISFQCHEGYEDGINGAWGVANDAFFYGEMSGQFFVDIFGKRSLPYKPRLVVHYGQNYENAFWTGTDMFFGDGKSFFYPLVYIDIIAHELAHGITVQNSDLVYLGRPGGINEAFSDISSVVTYYYMTGRAFWSIGSVLLKSGSGALRYFDNPPRDGKSIKSVWGFRPFMNVHYSSGVFNHAYYHMVQTYNVDIYEAFTAFLNANRLLWGRFTRFWKGACNTVQAGYDTGHDYSSMIKSFRKTGLLLFFCRHRALTTTMFPGETKDNILVSRRRSPILEIDMSHWSGSRVEISAIEDGNAPLNVKSVHLVIAADGDATNIIAKGKGHIDLPTNYTKIYVKLMSRHKQDVKVTLKVLE